MENIISQKVIETFLNGEDPEKYIVGVEYDYQRNLIYKIIQDPERGKVIKQDKLTPFLWVADLSSLNFYDNSKSKQRAKMHEHGIIIEKLRTDKKAKLENGMKYLVKSTKGYRSLLNFFKQGGIDPWGEKTRKYFVILNVVEQFLIQTKKRLFKGIEEYEDVHRFVFDIETTGLNPETDKIILIGVKDNRGMRELIPAFGENGERECIIKFFRILNQTLPTIVGGYNSASFDFPFIEKRAEILGMDLKSLTRFYAEDDYGIGKRDGLLKLAAEVEPYNQYSMHGFTIVDISHSVRRAQAINSDIKSWGLKYITDFVDKKKPNRVYVDGAFISKIYLENESYYINPKTGNYRKIGTPGTEDLLEKYPGKYEIWSGRKIVEQYLDDDLYETMVVDDSFSQSTFLLSKLVPTTYDRLATMGTATLWKLIMLAWSYENNLAIPEFGQKRKFTGGLSRLLNVGYAENVVKFDYSSLYPSIQLVYDIFPESDIMNVQKSLLKYFRDVRINYKNLALENKDTPLEEFFDRKQLPIKIFINGYFGSLSAPHIFPWGDVDKGEFVTCMGRQSLRMMIMWFGKRGYKPLVMDTDGVNFSSPKDVDNRRYIGKGLNDLVNEGEEYTGIKADVAEFNDIFMRGEMGLDIDYIAPTCVNVSRKNYIIKMIKKGKEKIKLTGNTIKSKKLPTYIAEFLDVALLHLLNGEGEEFLDLYYDYVTKIYNQEIPLSKVANKARVKMSIPEYKRHIKKKTKAGNSMSRQAHMELILENDYHASLGEIIYYVNNGERKSHGDVQKLTKPKYEFKNIQEKRAWVAENGKVPRVNDGVKLNCYMLSQHDVENEPDKTGEYNVPRYLANFNKRVEPLLVAFSPEIRDDILIDNPQKRPYFTPKQCELDNGHPMKEGSQDDIKEVMTLSDMEIDFWSRIGKDPYVLYIEDSIKEVDQRWVDYNRALVNDKRYSYINSDDDVMDIDGHDYALHTDMYSDDD